MGEAAVTARPALRMRIAVAHAHVWQRADAYSN